MPRPQSFWRCLGLIEASLTRCQLRVNILPWLYLAILILFVTATSPLSAGTTSLIGYWPFYEGAGTTATDLSGKENTGTLVNEPTWGAGRFGYGISFNGADQYVEIAHSDSLSLAKQLTISAWIYNKAAADSLLSDPEFHIIAAKGWAPDAGGSWTLGWDKKSNDLSFCVRKESDKGYNCVFFSYETLVNGWHHIAAVFNSGKISLYVDGSLAAGPIALGATRIHNNTEAVRIGAVLQNASSFLQNWHGDIDEVQINNQALTDVEIKALYQAPGHEKTADSPTTSSASVSQASSTTSSGSNKSAVATPIITPNGGTYSGPVNITLTTSTPGAFIYYSTDGTSPTQSSKLYKTSFTVAATTLVKAKAFKNNSNPSSEASAWFIADQQFDFSITNSGDKATKKGSSAQNIISSTLKSGSSKAIFFSVSGLPAGVSSSFSAASCNPTCFSTLTISTSSSTPTGTFPIGVSGSDGGVSRSTSFNLTVSELPTVATPTITPNGGSYTGSVSMTMATATAGASIYYTTDGTTPTQLSSRYTGAITLTSSATVKAAAFMSGYYPSGIASTSFTINQAFDFSLSNSGNKSVTAGSSTTNPITATLMSGSTQAVAFSASGLPSGAAASFSSVSCTPTCSSMLTINTSAVTSAGPSTITVSATGGGLTRSTSFSLSVNLPTVVTPTITPNGGSYAGSVSVTMATATAGATIYYTSDGSTPTQSSKLYTEAFTLTSSATVRAVAFMNGYNPSGVANASFTIVQPFDFSLSNSGNKSATAGTSVTNSITANLLSSATQAVSYSISGLPSGTSASFSATSCSPSCSTVLNLNVSNSTAVGTYTIVVTASGGGITRTTGFNLTVSSAAPSISVNKTSYTSGEPITVTVNGGNSNVQEWIALYIASNPDSAWSFEGKWQYLNGQQIAPITPVTYPVTLNFTAPSTAGTYDIRYFAYNGYSNRVATSQSFTATAPTITSGNLKYVSPNGSGTTCSGASPCAISRIGMAAAPGDTWVLKNGIYIGSGSVLFINGINGTPTSRIRVTAETPGGAILQGDGAAGHVLRVINTSYWDFDNLVVRNRDNPGNTLSNASIIGTWNVSNVTFKKMVATDNNTYGNNDGVLLQGTNILFEDSDVLRSHRNFVACYPATSSNITIRRVYVGQPVADHSNSGPGDGFVFYSCRDSVNENSIAEGLDGYGFTGWGNDNSIRGAIAMNNNGGLFNGTASSTADQGQNFTLTGYVGVTNNGTCAYFRPAGTYVVDGVTCIGNQVIADNSITNGSSSFGVTLRNTIVQNTSNSGFYLSQSNGSFTTKLVEYSQAWNTGGINGGWTLNNTPPSPPGDIYPAIGSCMVYVPDSSAYKGKGKGGADVGANIIYAYQDGTLTSNKLWNSSTGKMNYGPPVVNGVNDSSTGLVRHTLGSRLNITAPGCLPAGY